MQTIGHLLKLRRAKTMLVAVSAAALLGWLFATTGGFNSLAQAATSPRGSANSTVQASTIANGTATPSAAQALGGSIMHAGASGYGRGAVGGVPRCRREGDARRGNDSPHAGPDAKDFGISGRIREKLEIVSLRQHAGIAEVLQELPQHPRDAARSGNQHGFGRHHRQIRDRTDERARR